MHSVYALTLHQSKPYANGYKQARYGFVGNEIGNKLKLVDKISACFPHPLHILVHARFVNDISSLHCISSQLFQGK